MICTSYDEYLQDKDTTVWIAELSDGTQVYCDDGRYGDEDKAWNRLREYLRETGLYIQKIFLKFRSHTELACERDADMLGWFFGRTASAWVGQPTMNGMLVGKVYEGKATVTKWRVPELIKEETEDRGLEHHQDNIIWDKA